MNIFRHIPEQKSEEKGAASPICIAELPDKSLCKIIGEYIS